MAPRPESNELDSVVDAISATDDDSLGSVVDVPAVDAVDAVDAAKGKGAAPAAPGDDRTKPARPSTMSREEVLKAADPDALCLLIVEDKVYDATRWQHKHPGGRLTIRALCGKDATDAFLGVHDPRSVRMLKGFFYADLEPDAEPDELGIAFRRLTRQLEDAGLFETDYAFYYKKAAVYSALLATIVYGVTAHDSLWIHAASGALLGLFWQQVAFLGHDIGHNTLTRDRVLDSRWGLLVGNFLTGISIGWWKRSHNLHHVVTNSAEHDPDIQHLPVFAADRVYLEKPVFSTFFEKLFVPDNLAHLLVKFQHFLYYPVMAFARINLYVQSLTHALGIGPYSRDEVLFRRDLQVLTLFGFWGWLLTLTFQLPNWTSRIVFFTVAHNVAGILHVQIMLSHYFMPVYEGITYDSPDNGFLVTQLRHSIDVDCPWWMDWFHGGLQFQVEHHVWSKLPRHNYRKVMPILRAFCKEHGLEYHTATFLEGNKMLVRHLRETARQTRGLSELFWDSLNCAG